jgi:hypothetical protein
VTFDEEAIEVYRHPDSMETLYAMAGKHLAQLGGHGAERAYWVFQAAAAEAEREIADRRLKALEKQAESVFFNAQFKDSEAAQAIILANGPNDLANGYAEKRLINAAERALACAGMVRAYELSSGHHRETTQALVAIKTTREVDGG